MAAAWHSLAHLAQPGTVLLLAWQWGCHPHQRITGTAIARLTQVASTAIPTYLCRLCIWGFPGPRSSLARGESARAELSHATCPGQRPQQGEANPALSSPKAIKNEAHSAAQLSSDQITARERAASPSSTAGAGNATWTAQHPHASNTHAPGCLPPKINWQAGWQEKTPSSALPPCGEMLSQRQQRGEPAAPRRVPLRLFSAAPGSLKDTMAVVRAG